MSTALLEVDQLTMRFGGILALDDVSLTVKEAGIVGLIGPNGAGKTTIFNCISNLYKAEQGEIRFDRQRTDHLPSHAVAARGIGRTFQNLALLNSRSVAENILLGAHLLRRGGIMANIFRSSTVTAAEQASQSALKKMLAFLGLEEVADRRVGDLPFGTKKRVELGRALLARPRLLLLDEPACGLNFSEVSALRDLIKAVRDDLGISILLIEHHMQLVMAVSDHIDVLSFGKKIAEGSPADIKKNPEVLRAYLGATLQ